MMTIILKWFPNLRGFGTINADRKLSAQIIHAKGNKLESLHICTFNNINKQTKYPKLEELTSSQSSESAKCLSPFRVVGICKPTNYSTDSIDVCIVSDKIVCAHPLSFFPESVIKHPYSRICHFGILFIFCPGGGGATFCFGVK